jgi:hypothetical protein
VNYGRRPVVADPAACENQRDGHGGFAMRLKEDGSLDLDWREPLPGYRRGPRTAEDYEAMYEELISQLFRDHPTLTREKAERSLEGFL